MKNVHIIKDERVIMEQNRIYRYVFWGMVGTTYLANVVDNVCMTVFSAFILPATVLILLFWMAARGVFLAGFDQFPRICVYGALAYAALSACNMAATFYVIFRYHQWGNSGNTDAQMTASGTLIMSALTFLVFGVVCILLLYLAFRISRAKRQRLDIAMEKETQ